jgi:3-dehydroquinate synthase
VTTRVRAGACDVVIGHGLSAELPDLLAGACPAHSYGIVADHKVAELHGAALLARFAAGGLRAHLVHFPAGEWNKTRDEWARLTDQLLAAGLGRDGAIVTFGGGVAGDLGGFVAATYLRGVPVVHLPTTLLAMIDASVGGKTGVDVPAGKNLVGAFHPPRLVVADVRFLESLPRPHLAAGMAEALKHGVIADAAYFDALADPAPVVARVPEALERVVARSVEIKAAIVERDEREAGERQVLNFGHTVAHAVEAAAGYGVLHGEAVAIGMVVEARLAEQLGLAAAGLREALARTLARYGLPTRVPEDLDPERLLEWMTRDKKVRARELRFALPAAIGAMRRSDDGAWTVRAPLEVIRQVLDSSR